MASNANIRFLSLTGLIISSVEHQALQSKLDKLKSECFGHSSTNPVILHRSEIVKQKGHFKCLADESLRNNFDSALLKIIQDHKYEIITVTIDKKEHLERYKAWHHDPYHYCLECLLERYVRFLKSKGSKGTVTIEPRYKLVDKKLKESFNRLWREGNKFIKGEDFQSFLISRDIKFSPKKENSAGMQLCDLLAYPSYRRTRQLKEGTEMVPNYGAKILSILEQQKYLRQPNTGKIEGWGMKWLP